MFALAVISLLLSIESPFTNAKSVIFKNNNNAKTKRSLLSQNEPFHHEINMDGIDTKECCLCLKKLPSLFVHQEPLKFECTHSMRHICHGCWGKVQDLNVSDIRQIVQCPICKANLNSTSLMKQYDGPYTESEITYFGDNDIEAIARLNRNYKKVYAAVIGSVLLLLGVGTYLLFLLSKPLH